MHNTSSKKESLPTFNDIKKLDRDFEEDLKKINARGSRKECMDFIDDLESYISKCQEKYFYGAERYSANTLDTLSRIVEKWSYVILLPIEGDISKTLKDVIEQRNRASREDWGWKWSYERDYSQAEKIHTENSAQSKPRLKETASKLYSIFVSFIRDYE